MNARERIALLIDEGTFKEEDITLSSANPLDFTWLWRKKSQAQEQNGMYEGVIGGIGEINGFKSQHCMYGF